VRGNLRIGWIAIVLLVVVAIMLPAGPRAQWKTRWSYEGTSGPEHWGDLDPDYAACKVGKEQSPIDIRNAKKTSSPPSDSNTKAARSKSLTTVTRQSV
jgi:carbonic anhydrase